MIFKTTSTNFKHSMTFVFLAFFAVFSLTAQSNCDVLCPNDFQVVADTNGEYVVQDYFANGSVTLDECAAGAIVTQNPPPGTVRGLGEFEVQMTVTSQGETDDCEFDITVVEMQGGDCDFDCPDDQLGTVDANGDYIIPDYATNGALVITGNCGDVTSTQDPAAGTVVSAGTYVISLTAENGAGTSTISCGFNLTVDGSLNVATFTNDRFSLYPNPADGTINFSENVDVATISSYTGKLIIKKRNTTNIDVSDLSQGVYLVTCVKENIRLIKKVVVQ